MIKKNLNKLLPHLIAVAVFLVVAVIYCKPTLEGKVVSQHDITHWKGAIQQSKIYEETHGQYPLWTNSLFSGMPAFQIGYPGNNHIPWYAHKVFTLNLPKPIQFFFLACISFYFLCVVLRIRPITAIMGSLAFAYATYNPVIITAGHDTKMLSIAYMPALLTSVLLIYEKKYWLGAALTALFASVLISMNHVQIAYYLFLAIGIMTLFFAYRWIKNKEFKHLVMAAVFTTGAALIGVLTNAVSLMSTYEYQKETIRGGYSDLSESQKGEAKTGLTKEYAFDYSMGIAEPFVMMVPRMFGGSSDKEEMSQEESKAIEVLSTLPQELQQHLPMSYYWGGVGFTSGPPYVGAIICFLAIMGMFVLNNKHKWWALTAIGLTIIMSWGHYFESFNNLLYHYLPFYNKFRAPSMILVIPQLLLTFLAVLTVNSIITAKDKKVVFESFKKGLMATGVVFVVLLGLYFSLDFLNESDKGILNQIREINNPQLTEAVKSFFDALKEDRQSMMMSDIMRSLAFAAAAALMLFLFLKNMLKPVPVMLGLLLFSFIDVMAVNVKYLNSDNFIEELENESVFQKTKVDEAILADTSYFRVFNMSGNRFNENITSYYYNSVGGYHPAKLRIYQDLIEKQLSRQEPNFPVLNMLNTKYLILKNQLGQTQDYQPLEGALGPVWFVKSIRFVKDANEEMAALDHFNPKDTAIVQESFKTDIPFMPQADNSASIQLIKNDNDIITYTSNAATNQFAVFSEIFYRGGWKAYIDGKETPIVKVNYVLRGLAVPAGKHEIVFRFEPHGFYTGKKVTTVFSSVLLFLLAAGLFMEWRNHKKAVS